MCLCRPQADKNDVYNLPKELHDEKVATFHLPVLGAALTVLTQEHTVSRGFKVEDPITTSLVCSLPNVTPSTLCRRMASLHLPVLMRRSLSLLRNTQILQVSRLKTRSRAVCQLRGRPALQCCGSHSGYILRDMCRELFHSCHRLTQKPSTRTETRDSAGARIVWSSSPSLEPPSV